MQVFVPPAMADRMARLIRVGKMYIIKKFQVKDYTAKDKFRPVQMDTQIVFITDTKVKEIDENDIFIPKNMFDFYQFEDLPKMAKQVVHLVDIVGIIQDKEDIKLSDTSKGKTHMKFKITDGR